jgi:hypothetical protein
MDTVGEFYLLYFHRLENLHLEACAVLDETRPDSNGFWGIVQVSLTEIGSNLHICKISLQRSL